MSLTEGFKEHVPALTTTRGKSGKKLDRLASNVSAIHERMHAQYARAARARCYYTGKMYADYSA